MGKSTGCDEEEWTLSNSVEDEEESLSLCDLPNNNKEEKQTKKESPRESDQEDFDFWWWGGNSSLLKESEMCAADDVFFQGQILPLRHSVGSDGIRRDNGAFGYSTGGSSRSSSTRSHLSSASSGSSSTSTTIYIPKYYNKKPTNIRTQTPQVSRAKVNNNCSRNSTLWSLLRVGLVATPEIALQDLKIRNNYKALGSRNSSSKRDVKNNGVASVKRNLKQSFSNKNMILFNACSCSVNDVQTVPPKMAKTGRSSSAKEGHEEDKKDEATKAMRKLQQTAAGKQTLSRLRTFEWLKQLSLEAAGPPTL